MPSIIFPVVDFVDIYCIFATSPRVSRTANIGMQRFIKIGAWILGAVIVTPLMFIAMYVEVNETLSYFYYQKRPILRAMHYPHRGLQDGLMTQNQPRKLCLGCFLRVQVWRKLPQHFPPRTSSAAVQVHRAAMRSVPSKCWMHLGCVLSGVFVSALTTIVG